MSSRFPSDMKARSDSQVEKAVVHVKSTDLGKIIVATRCQALDYISLV